ncbi:MAG: hypothetical protein RIF39_16085 [Cyclobacteriaceae bacterium]
MRILLLLFFVVSTGARAQWYKASVSLKDGTKKDVEVKLNLKNGDKKLITRNKAEILCEKIATVTVYDENGNQLTLQPLIYFTEKYSWGIPIIVGKVSLYRLLFDDETLKLKFKEEKKVVKISSRGNFGYGLTKNGYKHKGRETYMLIHYPGAKVFNQFELAIEELFKDCPEIITRTKNGQYNIETAEEMVNYYNKGCDN